MEDKVIGRAREILCDNAWTQGMPARREDGTPTGTLEDNATHFCPAGALYKAGWELHSQDGYEQAFRRLSQLVGGNVCLWNDEPGQNKQNVLAAFDVILMAAQIDAAYDRIGPVQNESLV